VQVIIEVNPSFVKKINVTEGKRNQKQADSEIKIFQVPLALGEIKENITITTNSPSKPIKPSKEELINQAFKYHSQGNIAEAAKYYQLFINQGFKDDRVFSNYGSILKDLGKLQEAELSTRKAIEINPKFAGYHSNLGNILKNLDNIQEAELSYRKAVELNPNFADSHLNLGNILRDMGKLEEAELSYRKAIKLNPNYADAHSNLGNILRDLGKSKEAEISTRKAIELKPDFAIAYLNLGLILKDRSELKEAEISLRKAIEFKPDYANAYSNLGLILKDLGKLKEAEISLRKAIEFKQDYEIAHLNLGLILKDLGKSKEADYFFSKALYLTPNFYLALKNRWQFFFDKGEFALALKDADSCNTKSSRAFALESLYALGKIDEIYKRIDKTSQIDDTNIKLAAFSAFISAQERKNTSNNFCPNPLSFLYYSNLKSHVIDQPQFIREIINELKDIETVWSPKSQSTNNGFQTPIDNNLFSNPTRKISQVQSIISDEIEKYYIKYGKEKCSFIEKWPSHKNLVGWHVILKKQGYQSAHIHPAGWLSGVIYLKVVPHLERDEGAIEFSLNSVNYFNENSPKLTFHPELGDIVLFPSSLHHRTIPFSTDTDRIVMAFDLIPD